MLRSYYDHCHRRALGRLPGVERVQVNAETERVTVDYASGLVSLAHIERAFEDTGYGAELVTPDEELADRGAISREAEVADTTRRFLAALVLTIPAVFGAMWHLVASLPGGAIGSLIEFLELVLTTPVPAR